MIDAIDCVLYPCMYVIENQLLVRRFKTSVIFRHAGGKRDVVFFPILGMAHRLFSSKSTSEKNGKTKAQWATIHDFESAVINHFDLLKIENDNASIYFG